MKSTLNFACFVLLMTSFGQAVDLVAAPTQKFPTLAGTVWLTPLHRASVRIDAGGKVIYIDPAKPFDFSKAPLADLILISDIDEDHMDPDAVAALSKPGTEIISSAAVTKTLTTAWPMDNWENKTWQGWTIEAVPNYNVKVSYASSKHIHENGRANGYVLTYGDQRFYFSGGASAEVPELWELKKIDVAVVCVYVKTSSCKGGGLGAFFSARVFRPRIVIPYNYCGTDKKSFESQFDGTGIEVRELAGYSE